jgi:diguanylate cyclase (GGDEF)-like protein
MDNKNIRPRRDGHRAATQPPRRAIQCALGSMLVCFTLWATAAAAQPAATLDLDTVKARIAQDDRRRPVVAIQLAQQALAQASHTPEERRWLRSQLILDLVRLRRHDEALAQAQAGRDEARDAKGRLHFDVLAMRALADARRNEELLKRYQGIAALLPPLVDDASDAAARMDAANAWRLAGTAMLRLGQLPESSRLLTQALRVFDERPDAVYETSQTLVAMALMNAKLGHPDQALGAVQRAIDASEAANDRASLPSCYLRKAYVLGLLGRPDDQQAALLKARTLAQEELRPYELAVAATNLADVALQKKDYRAALAYTDEAIPLVERSGDKESLWVAWVNKGTALNRLGQPDGLEWIRKAIAAFAAAPGMESNVAEVHGLLAEELAFNHEHERAYEAAMQFKRLTDGVRKAADQKRVAEANAAYEADKRQRQIEALEQEQRHQQRFRWMLALAAVAGLAAAAVAVVSRYHVKKAYGAMRDMAFSDPLTGLRNRRHLVDTIATDLAQARRLHAGAHAGNANLAFMMIDVDHFKAVNDVHGHAAGDAVLKQCAAVLQHQLRGSDTLVRWGGEEFLVLARQTNPHEVHVLAERLRASIAAHDFVLDDGQVLRKTCSIGYACHPLEADADGGPPADWNDTVDLADQCLYLAKASGRDLWVGVTGHDARRARAHPGTRELRAGLDLGLWTLRWRDGRSLEWPQPAPAAEQTRA